MTDEVFNLVVTSKEDYFLNEIKKISVEIIIIYKKFIVNATYSILIIAYMCHIIMKELV